MLLSQSTFKMSFATAEEREFMKSCAAMPERPSQKNHVQSDVEALIARVFDRFANFLCQSRGERLVGVQKKDPIIGNRQRIQSPLPLLRPAPVIMELHDFGPEGSGDFWRLVRAVGVDHVHFTGSTQRFQAAGKISGFVTRGNNDSHRQVHGCWSRPRLPEFFKDLHQVMEIAEKY